MEDQFSAIESVLLAAGWSKAAQNPFQEKVSQGADLYFTYANSLGNLLGISIFADSQLLKFRLEHTQVKDFRWFQSEYGDKLLELVQAIVSEQNQASLSNYFGLYGTLSNICPTAFLAWEQWESNYR